MVFVRRVSGVEFARFVGFETRCFVMVIAFLMGDFVASNPDTQEFGGMRVKVIVTAKLRR